jgi:hypothetical protein
MVTGEQDESVIDTSALNTSQIEENKSKIEAIMSMDG